MTIENSDNVVSPRKQSDPAGAPAAPVSGAAVPDAQAPAHPKYCLIFAEHDASDYQSWCGLKQYPKAEIETMTVAGKPCVFVAVGKLIETRLKSPASMKLKIDERKTYE